MVHAATVNHQEAMVHLCYAHTPSEENSTTILGSDKITIDKENKNGHLGAMTMLSIFTKRRTIIAIAVRSMSHIIAMTNLSHNKIKSSSKVNLNAPTTIKENHNITTTITIIMIIVLKKNLKVTRFGMLVMMTRMSKTQGEGTMRNHINMTLVRRVVSE